MPKIILNSKPLFCSAYSLQYFVFSLYEFSEYIRLFLMFNGITY